ncbi:MAG TPA: PadR family transcriptional regulator [Candidatus Binatia bacterium]|jgi:DNA-binding PadR family transcriptional regulator
MFRYLVLGLLRDGQLRHGYALMKEYRGRSGLRVSTGNFYRELQRLVGAGLVRTADNPSDADPRRAPYEITPSGRAEFDRWLSGPPGPGLGRYEDELSSRSLFLVDADPALAAKLLETWKEELWIRSKIYERERANAVIRPAPGQAPSFPILSILLTRNLKHIAADVEFINELAAAHGEWSAATAVKPKRANVERAPLEERSANSARKVRRP